MLFFFFLSQILNSLWQVLFFSFRIVDSGSPGHPSKCKNFTHAVLMHCFTYYILREYKYYISKTGIWKLRNSYHGNDFPRIVSERHFFVSGSGDPGSFCNFYTMPCEHTLIRWKDLIFCVWLQKQWLRDNLKHLAMLPRKHLRWFLVLVTL